MLISCRREGDTLEIGEQIEIRIIAIRRSRVTLGVVAPRDMKIVTRKLTEMEMANTMAAVHSVEFGQLLHGPETAEKIVFVLDASSLERESRMTDKENGGVDE
jgi:carbon storage regulator CsrA